MSNITPKKKASFLVDKMSGFTYDDCKINAIFLVDEILLESSNYLNAGNWMLSSDRQTQSYEDRVNYWNEVKHEIQNL
jgi:hypothetical protein